MKPCRHDQFVNGCRICELAATREDYAKLWGGGGQLLQLSPLPPQQKKLPQKLRDDCPYLGAVLEYCPSCVSGAKHVRECDLHGKCTLTEVSKKIQSCSTCNDYPITEPGGNPQEDPKSMSKKADPVGDIHQDTSPLPWANDYSLPSRKIKKKPVRVCLITPTMLMGGAERWMISLARFCDPRRIQWAGVALCWGQADSWMVEEMAEFMPVISAPGPGGKSLPYPAKPAKSNVEAVQMVAKDADVILAWGVHDLSKLLGDSAKGKPIVFVSHGSGEWTAKAAASNEDIVTHWAGVSEASILPLKRELRRSAKIIHNGIDVLRCEPTIGRAEQRSRWGVSGRDILVGYVGRYSPEKNPEAVAKAVRHLGEPYRGVYVGSGWQEKETREKVAQIAGSRCVFVEPDRQIGNVMNALDVLVLASHTEAFSLTLTEAWYCGVPTVATRVGAVPELEIDAGERLVVPVSINPDAKELADAVQKAIDMPIEQRRLAQLIAAKHSSWRMGHDWTEYLSSLIG